PANTAAQLQSLSAPTATGTFQSFALLLPHFAAAGSAPFITGAALIVAPGPVLAWSAAAAGGAARGVRESADRGRDLPGQRAWQDVRVGHDVGSVCDVDRGRRAGERRALPALCRPTVRDRASAPAEYDRLRRPHRPNYPQRGRARRRHRWDDGADSGGVRQLHPQS